MKTLRYSGKELFRIIGKNESNLERLEKELDVDLDVGEFGEIKIESTNSLNEYICEEMLEALAVGFNIEEVVKLKDEEILFKKIILKNLVKSSRINPIKGRIIGTGGKTKKVMEDLTETSIVIEEHSVGILGYAENVEIAGAAVDMLIHGAPHGVVYKYLERARSKAKERELPLTEMIREEILHPELKKAKPKKKKVKPKKKKSVSKEKTKVIKKTTKKKVIKK